MVAFQITLDDEDRTFDIALGIDGLNIHVRVTKGDHDHKFFPFWFKEVDLSPAIAARLPGNCRMWCPVYSQGQGYVQIGGALNGPNRHGVNTGGMRSLTQPSDHDPTSKIIFSLGGGLRKTGGGGGGVLLVTSQAKNSLLVTSQEIWLHLVKTTLQSSISVGSSFMQSVT